MQSSEQQRLCEENKKKCLQQVKWFPMGPPPYACAEVELILLPNFTGRKASYLLPIIQPILLFSALQAMHKNETISMQPHRIHLNFYIGISFLPPSLEKQWLKVRLDLNSTHKLKESNQIKDHGKFRKAIFNDCKISYTVTEQRSFHIPAPNAAL